MKDEYYERRQKRERNYFLVPFIAALMIKEFPDPSACVQRAMKIVKLSDEAIAEDERQNPLSGDEE